MPLAKKYTPDIYHCKETKSKFSSEYLECIQDRKRLKALKNHYLSKTIHSLPLRYGYVVILSETIKSRFLNKSEKAFLKDLIESENIDYLRLCYKSKSQLSGISGQLFGKFVQLDMLPHIYTYSFPSIDFKDMGKPIKSTRRSI